MYFPMMWWWDPTFYLVIIGLVLSGAASWYVNSTFRKYDQVTSRSGASGTDAAAYILRSAGIHDVQINRIAGNLTDNYNGRDKTLNLSQSTADSTSVAAIGVAAHECGHAVQDKVRYWPMALRAGIVPIANLGSSLALPIILVGVLLAHSQLLINIGIAAFSLALLFQLVTLPVEFNASRRAVNILSSSPLLSGDEVVMVKKVLTAAALTYVAAALTTFLQLLRLIILFGGNRDNN
ncbi:peptidase [Schleiferilactobacillus harbinensis]|jgi:Zn-dependent membrane protease YugP|uniref:Zinc metallopeptidase n=3 Tax=Schleiferilactobacillus harbinensis TaxID=304207 RepID=A0ABU7SWR9_9LACO|nr:zinc metallopeptidase [Schleiferilactobacillus harbinensis]KRM29919.1 zinc-dependent proteinase [Schleiferilactobacillus harbinensis DSM 16991]QEU47343.1 zinc metallopeptidase [Schleiferilactobacillus harbinensis]QFR62893.1 peptidase [Schleiferilactobacillus harbinensis]HAY52612.1 peptidase [Lactobacillus sp.]